ncbi:hypothetical protein DYB25_000093 [Aphanomyces astaci]|uniref:CLASP N-terminal domain-containing protein n=1 Tax=Aphanomyces astaci TaxID=112090 RepID=A0A397CFU6_APHAT|nr:hypothetical protein DYB25_000093 [Aphanomyces astaci]RHY09608.1 hypothetical protein DYB36_006201 [Aphanomyces astaci]RHY45825.1 hypothetical protein DYB38_000716 [Aphanomyces astaci]RHY71738.1 hypothetical protein DYB30_001142 [Aphanomyces astaci]RHY73359.1 hypothetical protein DYB34_000496 [Aphanomyces astaci]
METHRLLHALLQGPDSWRLQLQKLAGVQRVLDTVDNNVHDVDSKASVASCFLPVAVCEARCLIVQQVTTVVRVWPKSELAEHCDDLLLLLTGAIQDPKDLLRAVASEALCAFDETWYGRVYQVVA